MSQKIMFLPGIEEVKVFGQIILTLSFSLDLVYFLKRGWFDYKFSLRENCGVEVQQV